jgi:hypothetical protein
MNVRETLTFWREREREHPDELARTLHEFAVEEAAARPILAGTLKAAAERLERERRCPLR